MEKLKNRLDAFSDAIIAIIITIMVLDIPPVLHDSLANYMQLGKSVGVYFISFIFIANMWYQHGTAFSEISTMTYRIIILDMLFLMPLSLMPLLTNMMASNTTRITVLLYGVLQLVVNILFRYLAKAIIHLQYTEAKEMRNVYQKIYGNSNLIMDGLSFAALIMAFIQPELSLFVFLAYPVVMFLLNSSARQEMYDVAALPEEQQRDFTKLSGTDLRDFARLNVSFGATRASRRIPMTRRKRATAKSRKLPMLTRTTLRQSLHQPRMKAPCRKTSRRGSTRTLILACSASSTSGLLT